jgi:hypothetical protein
MKPRFVLGVFAVGVLAVAGVAADEALKSGPQVGTAVSPFHPLNLTGPEAGRKYCLV